MEYYPAFLNDRHRNASVKEHATVPGTFSTKLLSWWGFEPRPSGAVALLIDALDRSATAFAYILVCDQIRLTDRISVQSM